MVFLVIYFAFLLQLVITFICFLFLVFHFSFSTIICFFFMLLQSFLFHLFIPFLHEIVYNKWKIMNKIDQAYFELSTMRINAIYYCFKGSKFGKCCLERRGKITSNGKQRCYMITIISISYVSPFSC